MKRGQQIKKADLRGMKDFPQLMLGLIKCTYELGAAVSPHETLNKLAYKAWLLFEGSLKLLDEGTHPTHSCWT